MREQAACTVHYFVSSKNNDSYHFQDLPRVRMLPRLAPSFDHNMTAPNFKSSSIEPENFTHHGEGRSCVLAA